VIQQASIPGVSARSVDDLVKTMRPYRAER
jgi:hypothetical protein